MIIRINTPKGHSGLDPESVYPILFLKRILDQVQDDRYSLVIIPDNH